MVQPFCPEVLLQGQDIPALLRKSQPLSLGNPEATGRDARWRLSGGLESQKGQAGIVMGCLGWQRPYRQGPADTGEHSVEAEEVDQVEGQYHDQVAHGDHFKEIVGTVVGPRGAPHAQEGNEQSDLKYKSRHQHQNKARSRWTHPDPTARPLRPVGKDTHTHTAPTRVISAQVGTV